jgi:hypothetical protein
MQGQPFDDFLPARKSPSDHADARAISVATRSN